MVWPSNFLYRAPRMSPVCRSASICFQNRRTVALSARSVSGNSLHIDNMSGVNYVNESCRPLHLRRFF